jgi:hypothetical protein
MFLYLCFNLTNLTAIGICRLLQQICWVAAIVKGSVFITFMYSHLYGIYTCNSKSMLFDFDVQSLRGLQASL